MELSNVSVLDTRRKILLNTPHIDTSVGDLGTFNTDLSAPLKSCKVSFLPVQEGEGDPSPDNVREIAGWNGVNIYKAGQNLIPNDIPVQFYRVYPSGGHFIESGTAFSTFFIPVPKGKICLARTTRALLSYGALCDELPTVGASAFNAVTMTNRDNHIFDNSEGHKYFAITTGRSVEVNSNWESFLDTEPRLTMGDTVQPYIAPTNISTHLIDWTDSVGTIYGGYIDLVSGELVTDRAIKTFDGSENWGVYNPDNYDSYCFTLDISDKKIKQETTICNKYKNVRVAWGADGNGKFGVFSDHVYLGRLYFTRPNETFEKDKTVWKAWLAENSIQICYELAEPIHYQLTPQQILTLKGINNVYSDTNGQTEIKYWKH